MSISRAGLGFTNSIQGLEPLRNKAGSRPLSDEVHVSVNPHPILAAATERGSERGAHANGANPRLNRGFARATFIEATKDDDNDDDVGGTQQIRAEISVSRINTDGNGETERLLWLDRLVVG